MHIKIRSQMSCWFVARKQPQNVPFAVIDFPKCWSSMLLVRECAGQAESIQKFVQHVTDSGAMSTSCPLLAAILTIIIICEELLVTF